MDDFEALWQKLSPEIEPQWENTRRVFVCTHAAYPTLVAQANSYDACRHEFYGLLQAFYNETSA